MEVSIVGHLMNIVNVMALDMSNLFRELHNIMVLQRE